jgi:hypothetical protein
MDYRLESFLNILPLGSYDVFLGMDWLASHKEKLNCYKNIVECEDEKGNEKIFKAFGSQSQ